MKLRKMVMKIKNAYSRSKWLPAQALVEVAIILPILLLLVLGAMDFGRLFFTKIVIKNAAREGVNYLAYHPCDAKANSDGVFFYKTDKAIQAEADSSKVTVALGDIAHSCKIAATQCCTSGYQAEILITKEVDLLFDGFLKAVGLVGGPIQVKGLVRMVVQ